MTPRCARCVLLPSCISTRLSRSSILCANAVTCLRTLLNKNVTLDICTVYRGHVAAPPLRPAVVRLAYDAQRVTCVRRINAASRRTRRLISTARDTCNLIAVAARRLTIITTIARAYAHNVAFPLLAA